MTTNWNYAASLPAREGLGPAQGLRAENVTKWESAIRQAIDVRGQLVLADWQEFRDTLIWKGPALAQAINMYDGVRTFLQAYFYFGCTDSVYLDYAYATANYYWLWMENNVGGQGTNFYNPQTVLFYPDGVTTLFKLDPGFTGGGVDDGLWLTRDANNIPEFFVNVVDNCQFGEIFGTRTDLENEPFSREAALTAMYYLDSLRVGNTLPATGRFDLLVSHMKNHARQWLEDGPDVAGIDSIEYMGTYNSDKIADPTVGSPGLISLRAWLMGLTAEAMIRTFNEHPSYATDSELTYWVERIADWVILNGRISDYPGAYAAEYYQCVDQTDPLAIAAGSPVTEHCLNKNPSRGAWHPTDPHSQNPNMANEQRDEITTPMAYLMFAWLFETTGKRKWQDELESIFNLHAETYDFVDPMDSNDKSMNQNTRCIFDVFRVLLDPAIYTNFDDGALPCT